MSKTKNDTWSIVVLVLLAIGAAAGITYGLLSKHAAPGGHGGGDSINMDTLSLPLGEEDMEADGNYDLSEGETYMVTVNGDTAFAVIEDVHGAHLQGSFYRILPGTNLVEAAPYDFVTRLFSNRLMIGDKEYSFQNSSSELRGFVDGQEHAVTDKDNKTYRFKAVSYMQPAFSILVDHRYLRPLYRVRTVRDITYGKSNGYWTENGWDNTQSYTKILFEGIRNTLNSRPLLLKMDVYMPAMPGGEEERAAMRHPLILFIHGGAYYVGGKGDKAITEWCNYYASLGYVCASIDYRMGFFPSREEIERAGYMAAQDANAAMRFLVHNAARYGIDPDCLFAAGCSAGAITALNMAFMTDDERPLSSYGFGADGKRAMALANSRAAQAQDTADEEDDERKGLFGQRRQNTKQIKEDKLNKDNLGSLTNSGNAINERFHIRAVANMWGAVADLDEMENGRTDIISFHGSADNLVPYDKGYPFQDADNKMGKRLVGNLYGSASITRKAQSMGLRAKLNTLPGMGHAPHLNEDHSINRKVFNLIRDSITAFFYTEMVPQTAVIMQDGSDARHFYIAAPQVSRVVWHVEGGFVVSRAQRSVRVVWIKNAPVHRLQASGIYDNGIGFSTQREVRTQ